VETVVDSVVDLAVVEASATTVVLHLLLSADMAIAVLLGGGAQAMSAAEDARRHVLDQDLAPFLVLVPVPVLPPRARARDRDQGAQ
jgi:hypothetical protein